MSYQPPVIYTVPSRIPKNVPDEPLKDVNDIPLTSEYLLVVLGDLSNRIETYFGAIAPVELVIHGGAVMVMHKDLGSRNFTFDIDYMHRAFDTHWTTHVGLVDASVRLRKCIAETSERFRLGRDWMNAHADVALPHVVKYVRSFS